MNLNKGTGSTPDEESQPLPPVGLGNALGQQVQEAPPVKRLDSQDGPGGAVFVGHGLGELGSYAEIELILPAGEYRVISSDPEDVESMVLEFMQEQPEGATPKGIREDLDQNQQSRACTALVKALALTTTGKTNKTRYHLAEQAPKLT